MAVNRTSAAIGSLGFGMLLAASALAWLFGTSDTTVQGSFALGAGLLGLAMYRERSNVEQFFRSRAFQYGGGSSVVVALVGLIAVMGYLIATKYDKSVDLTVDSRHSLAQQTKSILAELTEPVHVIAFYENDSPEQVTFRTMIRRFQEVTPQLEVEFVDPLRQPLMANNYGITSEYGAVILEAGERKKELSGIPLEKELARALMLLFSDEEHRVCWSLGHGEPSPDDTQADDGFGGVVIQLESLNYTVTKSYILTEGIDPQCEILVIVRPVIDWMEFELAALSAYVAGGGQVFAALDPGMASSLTKSLSAFGVQLADDVIVDVNPKNRMMGVDDSSYVVLTHDDVLAHPITRDLSAALVLGIARSVTPLDDVAGIKLQRVLETSEEAWAETQIADFPNVQPDEGELVGSVGVMVTATVEDPTLIVVRPATEDGQSESIRGRLMDWFGAQFNREPSTLSESVRLREELGAGDRDIEATLRAVEELFGVQLLEKRSLTEFSTIGDVLVALSDGERKVFDPNAALDEAVPSEFTPQAGGRLVVIGDADFATNSLLEFGNNQDLFLNTIAWLAEEERQIGERPSEGEKLTLTGFGESLFCLLSLGVVPGSAILIAVLLLVRRRYL